MKDFTALVIGLVIGVAVAVPSFVSAQAGGGFGQVWIQASGYLKAFSNTVGLQVPSLVSCDTIDTNALGRFVCGTDGGGGSGNVATSTTETAGQLSYWTTTGATPARLGKVATGTLSESVTGLEFSASRAVVGGATALSLTTGFNIPLTASTTNWNGFYNTPSTRITAGNHIDWTVNSLDVVTTGDWTGTIDGNNFAGGAIGTGDLLYGSGAGSLGERAIGTGGQILAVSGGLPTWVSTTSIPLAGDVTGTLSATVVGNDSHDHTGATLSGVDISSDTNLAGDAEVVLTGDSLSLAASVARDSELHSAVTLAGALDYITLAGQVITRTAIDLATDITGVLALGNGGTGANLTDPNADRIFFWDDSAGASTWLALGTNLSITGTTLDAASGGSAEWTDTGTTLYPNEVTDRVSIGTTSPSVNTTVTISATSSDSAYALQVLDNSRQSLFSVGSGLGIGLDNDIVASPVDAAITYW